MKKVMLFTITLLFSMGANAANISIDPAPITNDNVAFNGFSSNNAPVAILSWNATDSTGINIYNNVSSDVDATVMVTWGYNPGVLSGTVNQYDLSGSDSSSYTTSSVSGMASYSYVMKMLVGSTYYLDFSSSNATIGTAISLSVQEIEAVAVQAVPIPAALWLFAPALMGLLGLRRKSKGLVVA